MQENEKKRVEETDSGLNLLERLNKKVRIADESLILGFFFFDERNREAHKFHMIERIGMRISVSAMNMSSFARKKKGYNIYAKYIRAQRRIGIKQA